LPLLFGAPETNSHNRGYLGNPKTNDYLKFRKLCPFTPLLLTVSGKPFHNNAPFKFGIKRPPLDGFLNLD